MSGGPVCQAIGVCLLIAGVPSSTEAQRLSVDVSAGRLVYDQAAANVTSNNLLGTLRYDRDDAWLFGSIAAPLGGADTTWGAGGAGGRLRLPGRSAARVSYGADLDAHAFVFHDQLVDQSGSGGTLEALPFMRLTLGTGFLEGHAGWRGHTIGQAGTRTNRDVVEGGVRAGAGGPIRFEAESRWVSAPEGVFPFVGGSVSVNRRSLLLWAHAGRWLDDALDDPVWGGGVEIRLTSRTNLWTSLRQEAPDPLYWNSARRTWSIGATQRLGKAPSTLPLRSLPAGVVALRIPVQESESELFVGGDFNNWELMPMRREGKEWVATLQLSPGTYHYAFRNARGEWFVPTSMPGRRDDGMGGYVAVLMVS
jgi:hypothetical protein